MKLSIISIRSKIWLCVLIALAGYMVATMASFYTNIKQYQHLSHLQEEHYPLASLGSQLLNTFELQTGEYEDAFMVGEQSLAIEANAFKDDILQIIDDIFDIINASSFPPISKKRIAAIREEYLAFATLAENIYSHPIYEELSRDDQKKIRQLGLMQGALMKGISNISTQLDVSLIEQIEQDKKITLYTVILLVSLFLTVLVFVSLIVDRVANKLLITPLSRILENIKRFSLGQKAIQPSATADSDEIGHLAMAFWDMTENLKTTKVSRKSITPPCGA